MTEPAIDLSLLPKPTLETSTTLYGSRFIQGGRVNYLLDLSPLQILSLVPRPNPDIPTVGNRRIDPRHAAEFGAYQRATPSWVVPGIMLRVEKPFDFKPIADGLSYGAITFPRTALSPIHILDGQHRILGFFDALDGIAADRSKYSETLSKIRRNQAEGEEEVLVAIKKLDEQAKRFERENIPVQIIVEADPREYRQMFYDIAENAKGITASVRARFDSRKVVNRSLESVLTHPLLDKRTDPERDRVKRNSPYLITARHVLEIMRVAIVGLDGRIGKKTEAKLTDGEVVKIARELFDTFVRDFPQFEAIINAQISPERLRETSLLGNSLFLRILAAVRHDLIEYHAFTPAMVDDFFKKLSQHAALPLHENSIWVRYIGAPVFLPGVAGPSARRQDSALVVERLVDWAVEKPAWLDKAALPAPAPKDESELTEEELDELLRPETAAARKAQENSAEKE